MPRRLAGLAGVLALAVAPAAWGARPLDTEDTGTATGVEVELGADVESDAGARAWTLGAAVNLGIWPNLEVNAAGAAIVLEPDDVGARAGVGDTVLGLKYRAVDETARVPALLARLTLRLPTGSASRGLGAPGTDVGLLVAASKQLGPVVVTGNVGYTFVTADRAHDVVTLAASVEWPVGGRWVIVAEVVAQVAGGDTDRALARGGVRYQLFTAADSSTATLRSVTLDAALGGGLTARSPDVAATAGLTLGF
ncbi:MAG TPA: transporter [Methylomirabilota bacterium]|jgi:hypothetical protein|nr:transporter [Methylomirabilota bacterium]